MKRFGEDEWRSIDDGLAAIKEQASRAANSYHDLTKLKAELKELADMAGEIQDECEGYYE